jgi:PAS domain S-box-containing protein
VEFVQNVANILANAIDRKNREGKKEEKKQQKRFYEAILSSTPDLVYVFDLDYRFIYANDALLEMWGRSREEALGKTLREVGCEPWHAEMHERELDQVVETKEPVRGEISFPHADLGERIYDYIFVPVLDNEGEVETIAGTTRDITELKETEEELQSTVESLEEFNSIMGHDLKSPLNTAQNYLGLALKLDDGEDDIEEAQKLLKRMEAMIEDLEMLTLSPETLDRKEVNLENAFTEAYTLAGVEASYEVENTTLEAGKGFTRLLSNLIKNSVEHNERTVKIRAEPLENEEGFYYEDNGKGIPEDKREKVLGRGFTTSDTGSGLGLYIVKRIAQLHDWNIEITESEEGGARFEFYT